MTSATARDSAAIPDVAELTSRPQADPFVEALSLLASELSGIAVRIQELERSHLERMETAAAKLREQIAADLKNQQRAELQSGIQVIQEQYEQRLRLATAQWEVERQALSEDVARHRNLSKVAQEVEQTEAALEGLQKNIQAMLDNPTVDLSRVMQENARQQQLQAYLRGLKFAD
jgi:DNA repair ATPase RecN